MSKTPTQEQAMEALNFLYKATTGINGPKTFHDQALQAAAVIKAKLEEQASAVPACPPKVG
jgi:hypothetical protein